MKVDVLNMQGQKVATTELPAAIFEAPILEEVMHQALVRQLANGRLGTRKTKTRGEVVWRRQEALAPEGHGSRPAGIDSLPAVARWRQSAYAHAA